MRYLLGFLAVIGLVIVVVVLIIRGLTGDGATPSETPLTDYTHTDTVMRMTIEGPVNNEQVHESVRITVGRTESTIEKLQGYHKNSVDSMTYPSNAEAYGVFLRALELMQYDRGSDDAGLQDSRGVCPKGNIYTFEIRNGNEQIQSYWRSTCGQGNFGGQAAEVEDLFKAQIPDYGKFIRNINL